MTRLRETAAGSTSGADAVGLLVVTLALDDMVIDGAPFVIVFLIISG